MPIPGDHDEPINPNGHFGFPRIGLSRGQIEELRLDQEKSEAADEATGSLMASAEILAALCDRHRGDNGDDADLIDELGAEIDELAARIRAALGEPRDIRHGVLVPRGVMR